MKKQHTVLGGRWVKRSLFFRGGRWLGRVRDTRTGRIHEISTRETKRAKAEQAVIAWIEERVQKEATATDAIGFKTAYEEFLKTKVLRPGTEYEYNSSFTGVLLPFFGSLLVEEIERRDVERFLTERRNVSARTRQKHLTMLRSFARWAVWHRYCLEDFTAGLRVRGVRRRAGVALATDQLRHLLAACRTPTIHTIGDGRRHCGSQSWPTPDHLFLAVLIGAHTALRRGNILALRWDQLDLGQRRLTIAADEYKTAADLVIPIHPELAAVLEATLRERCAEAARRLGRSVDPGRRPEVGADAALVDPHELVLGRRLREFSKSWKSALARAGLPPMRLHDLRHTAITAWSLRFPHAVVQALAGHAPPTMTAKYTHVAFETLKAAVDSMPRLLEPAEAVAPPPAAAPAPALVGQAK
jgi:integrase